MNVTIQISDAVYAKLLSGTTCVKGSIRLVNPTEGSFNAWKCSKPHPRRKYMKLPHGRVSMSDADVRMSLKIAYSEAVIPSRTIEAESALASHFIDLMEEL